MFAMKTTTATLLFFSAFFLESLHATQRTITNQDGVSMRIVCFAEHTYHQGTVEVVSATERKVDFPKKQTVTIEGNSYGFENYKSEYSNYEYGWEQAGYVIVIKNSKGDITHVDANHDNFKRNLNVVMKCKVDEYYSSDLSQKRSSISSH